MPKLLVSTMASGDVSLYVGESDVTLMHSVVDVAGINSVSEQVFGNAAAAIAAQQKARRTAPAGERRPLVGLTMFGLTTPAADEARAELVGLGYEPLVFHATGAGGSSSGPERVHGRGTRALDLRHRPAATVCRRDLHGGRRRAGTAEGARLRRAGSRRPAGLAAGTLNAPTHHNSTQFTKSRTRDRTTRYDPTAVRPHDRTNSRPHGEQSMRMRAVVQDRFGDRGVLRLAEVERPEPIPTEVLVRVHAAGVNPVDVKTRQGQGMAGIVGEPPFILGWDVSGVVAETGFGVTTLRPGDEVYGMPRFPHQGGGLAEYVTAPSRHFARKPAGLSHTEAAALPLAGLTAWQILVDTAALEPGQRVLVHAAAGGVGHLAVQIAKARGAHVIGTARSAKHDFLRALGADETLDYSAVAFEDAVHDVDLVVDNIGDPEHQRRSLDVLRPGGLLIAVPDGVDPAVAEQARARGLRACSFLVEPDLGGLEQLTGLVEAGKLRPEVSAVLPLADAAKAHELIESGRTQGKVVLSVH
ncbi:zinc-binding dehydrogenase [Streptomyces sp. NPDC002514]|uniref:zinc-binding dehydrogenase n=1 Tax=Streptomyces sp. NPDC001270 TaxID=3364554 RepID=UPI00368A0985